PPRPTLFPYTTLFRSTNAALAGFMTVMASTPVTEDGKTRDKVTAFIVTPDLPGFEIIRPNRSKCGIRGSWQAELRFTDMRVPARSEEHTSELQSRSEL